LSRLPPVADGDLQVDVARALAFQEREVLGARLDIDAVPPEIIEVFRDRVSDWMPSTDVDIEAAVTASKGPSKHDIFEVLSVGNHQPAIVREATEYMSLPPRSSRDLSIVIPTQNTRELTLHCLSSISRAVPAAEVILVDDAGKDGTAEAAAGHFPPTVQIRTPQAVGFTRAANLGMARAGGEILLLLNSDTEVDGPGLDALRAAFAADPRLGAAGAALYYPDGSPQWSGGRAPSLAWLFALASGLPGFLGRLRLYRRLKPPGEQGEAVEWVTGAALAIRRSAWEEVGPLDEDFRFYGQDLDLCLRLGQAGWKVALLPGFRVMHHHGATISGKPGTGGGRQHPELLWTDLLRWARKHHGTTWARCAVLALATGGAARLLGRALSAPFLSAARRESRREETRAFRRALLAVLAIPRRPV
jgi:GT2 family glycosyltransferase